MCVLLYTLCPVFCDPFWNLDVKYNYQRIENARKCRKMRRIFELLFSILLSGYSSVCYFHLVFVDLRCICFFTFGNTTSLRFIFASGARHHFGRMSHDDFRSSKVGRCSYNCLSPFYHGFHPFGRCYVPCKICRGKL